MAKEHITENGDVVGEIERLHDDIVGSMRMSLDKAIRIGELLVEHKPKHGEFGEWIEKNLPFTHRTATNYMKIYRNRDKLKLENVSNLCQAYELMNAPETDELDELETGQNEMEIGRIETEVDDQDRSENKSPATIKMRPPIKKRPRKQAYRRRKNRKDVEDATDETAADLPNSDDVPVPESQNEEGDRPSDSTEPPETPVPNGTEVIEVHLALYFDESRKDRWDQMLKHLENFFGNMSEAVYASIRLCYENTRAGSFDDDAMSDSE